MSWWSTPTRRSRRLEEAERELAAIAGLEGGEVRIASFPSASATLLTMAVSDFVERHPKVRLGVTEAEPEESMPACARARSTSRSPSTTRASRYDDRDLERTLLLTESMHVALPKEHELAAKPTVEMAQLATRSG